MTARQLGVLFWVLVSAASLACVNDAPQLRGEDGKIVVAPEFERGALGSWLLGDNWRASWTQPIELQELDLESVAGGLRPIKQVGALQTLGLALAGADGSAYTFRTVRKRVDRRLPTWMRWGPQQAAFRDQGSAVLPAAALVVTRLMRDQGVFAPTYELVVMPDDARLAEFREDFAGRVGTLARYPRAGPDGAPGDFGAVEIVDSEELWRRWEAGQVASMDARKYLRARLVDWWVGDWDRHPQQWRWARVPERAGWQPLPEDHDQAFSDHGGAVLAAIRPLSPQLVVFDEELPMRGLRQKAEALDAWLLAGLDAKQWESELAGFHTHIDAARVDAAIAALPSEWQASAGPRLREYLRARLERLPEAARGEYLRLARQPHWHGSAARDRLVIECQQEGSVSLELGPATPAGGAPLQRRRFDPAETRRVVIDLYGVDDDVSWRRLAKCGIEIVVRRGADELPLDRGIPRT